MGILEGKVSLITGAGQGIGRGIALRFAQEGAAVGVLDVHAAACERVAAEIMSAEGRSAEGRSAEGRSAEGRSAEGRSAEGRAISLPADVTKASEVAQAVARLVAAFGPPTVLVHNAAVMPEGTLDQTSEADWDRVFAVNVKGAYLTCREVIPLMRQAGGGSISLMASITGVNGLPGLAAYSSTKGALIALARAMAIDHAREGIRVNSVSPGTIDSPMLHAAVAATQNPEATRRAFDEIQPRGSVGTIEEVVNIFVFLASDQASLISGANLNVDGGMSIKTDQPRL